MSRLNIVRKFTPSRISINKSLNLFNVTGILVMPKKYAPHKNQKKAPNAFPSHSFTVPQNKTKS